VTDRIPLKKALKRMIEEDALTERELASLRQLSRRASRSHWLSSINRVAAGLAVGFGAASVLVFVILSAQIAPPENVRERIAHEVLTNHLHIKPLDVETDSLRRIEIFLERLDFKLLASAQLAQDGLILIGGRYCTIQGKIAAQLRFKTPDGGTVTHYQAAYDARRFGALPDAGRGEPPIVVNEHGYQIKIWREAGLVMVTARPGSAISANRG